VADQVLDPIAAKYGGAAVADAEPPVDEVAKKYGGVLDPAARKFGGLPVDQTTGRPAPITVPDERQFTTSAPAQDLELSVGGQRYTTGRFTPLEAETILNSPAARGTVATAAVPPHVNAPEAPPELPVTDIGAPGQPMRRAPVNEGVKQAARGVGTLFDLARDAIQHQAPAPGQPSPSETALNAGSDILEGGFQALSPLLYAGLGVAPAATGAALVSAWAGSKGASAGTTALGGTPAQSRFAGNLAALVTGALAARAVSGGAESGAAKTATDGEAAQVDAAARAHAASVLGVDPNADPATVQSAYRAAARANHPDVGGDVSTMADINLAYEWLTDHPAPLTARAKVTLSDWIRQQAAWLRDKFPSRSAAAADAATANPPAPSSTGRELGGEIDPTAAQFGGEPLTSQGPSAGIAPENEAPPLTSPTTDATSNVPRGIPEMPAVDPVAEQFGGQPIAAARSPEGSGQGDLLVPAGKTPPKGSVWGTLAPDYQNALTHSLGSFQGGGSRWNELRLRGATDDMIREQLGQEYGLGGSSSGPGRIGNDHKGGKNPQVTLGPFGDNPIKLTGTKLIATVREAVGIPQPVQTIGGKPLAPARPIGFWDLKPEELMAAVGFDIAKPGESGPSAISTRQELDAFHNRLIDNLLGKAQTEGLAALPDARKLLGALEHLRDHSDPSDYDYEWDVEPFTRAIPEIERIVKRLEGQPDLPIEREGAPPAAAARKVPIPEGLEETRDYADVQKWATAEAARTGETVAAVLKAHQLPETPEAFAHWIYPATPGTPVPKGPDRDLGFKEGDEVHFKDGGRNAVGTITALVIAGKKGGRGVKALRRRARILSTDPTTGQRFETHRDLDEISKVEAPAAADAIATKYGGEKVEGGPLQPYAGDTIKVGAGTGARLYRVDDVRPDEIDVTDVTTRVPSKRTVAASEWPAFAEGAAVLPRREGSLEEARRTIRAAKKLPPPGITVDQMEESELKALGTDEANAELVRRGATAPPAPKKRPKKPAYDPVGPQQVGGVYRDGYWKNTFRVLAITREPYSVKVEWLDGPSKGQVATHSTPWDAKRDTVISQPEAAAPPATTEAAAPPAAARATTLPTRAFDVILEALQRHNIREPFPQGAVEFRKWMAEQLDVPVAELTEDIDVINDAAEAALAKHLRTEADSESLELALNQAINYEDLLPRAHRTLEKSKLQQFSTPLPIGLMAGHAADVLEGDRVLEPTAGTGSLLVGVPDDTPVTAVELAARRAELLRAAGLNVLQGDYLSSRTEQPTVIIANPPWGKYSTGKYGKGVALGFGPTDVAERFVGKMLRDLAPNGRLVAVMPTTMQNAASFKAWLRANYTVQAIIQAPPGAYDTRSTGVDSYLLVVDNVKPAAGAALPKTVVTADWQAYREAVEAIPERTHEPAALESGRRPEQPPRADTGPRAGRLPRTESAGGGPARPEPRRDVAVEPGRQPDVVAAGEQPRHPAPEPPGEFTQRVSGPSADARAKAQRSESFAPYPRRTALRGDGHPKLVVEARQLAGVAYPPLTIEPGTAVRAALAGGRVSVEQAEQSMAAVQANVLGHHGYLAADAVGVGKSREIALTILEAMERAQQAGREFRLVVTTKSSDNIADLIDREMYYVARGRTKDGTDLANPGAPKVPPPGLPFQVEMVTDRKNAKKFGTKEYEPLPIHKHGIYVIDSFNLAPYESALEEIGAHGVVGDEAHRFKNIEGAAVGGAWQRLHALIIRDVPRPEQFFAYFTATPAQAVEDYAYLYGLRLWPVDGFGRWLDLVTGSLSEDEAKKLQDATDKGAINIDRVTGNAGGDVVGGDGENETGAKKKGGGITNRSAFDARLTPTEGEQIPREWKMLGRFSARDLWRDGTEFSIHEAKLSDAHAKKYDQFVDLAQDIIETAAKYGTMDKSGRASRFGVTGLLQFAAKRIQMQPAIEEAIKLAQKEVATGHQVVLSLINVSEMNDERGHLTAAIDKINTRLVDADPDDPEGGFQDLGEIPEAIVDQARLRDRVRDLGTFDDPLKLVEDAVGKDKVAFIVGGTGATRQGQVADFQAGKRDYAVLSAAGSTGINLDHRVFTNKLPARGRRVFIDVQYEWSATESLQRYGRVDRASSITPPKIYALTFGSAAEKKFLATIANRMAALGALSKGGAESTGGASALEEFEITGDDALAAARKAYEELPLEGRKQFARIKSVFRDPNRETRPDRSGYDPYAPKPSGSGTVMQDFQLPLLFMPLKESNAFWKRFIELRDEFREKSGMARATRTERFKGEILNTAPLKENLTLYAVKNEANQKFGVLTGLVTQELPKIRQALKGGEYDPTTGRYETKFTRRYVTFTAGDQTITGLQIKWTDVPAVAELYDHHLQGEVLDTPEKVRQALLNGEKLPLQEKNPDSGKPWTLRYRQDQKIAIDNARMMDRALLLRHGADYFPVGGFWYVKDLAKFLERFPLAERATAPPKKPASGGGTTLQSTILPGGAEFFEQDVLPGLKGAGEAFAHAAAQLRQAVAPATIGTGAKAAGALRAMMAREAQENARMAAAAQPFQAQFDRLIATKAGREQAIDWWDAVQTGQPTKILPELTAAYTYMRRALDEERIEIQKYGKLEEFNEFYFPQIWKFPKQEAAWVRRKIAGLMGKRPFEGSKSFLKQRKYPTFREGLDALLPKGVEPISYNPVDHFLIKMREMRRYRVARASIKDFEQMGIWKGFRGAGVKPPEGWTRIEGPLGTIYGRPEVGFKEAFDPDLFEGLEKFARALGVRLERKPQIGGKRWGYAQGDRFIMTKAAGPEGVLMHELGHILDERYGLRGMVNDKKFREELRALADLRHEGTDKDRVRPGFKRYIRKGEEKIANLVHAFLYAPERAKKIAPNSYWALFNLAKKHAELRPLLKLQKTRSLKLGTRTHFLPIGGFPEIGFYAMPDDAARVFNNHLSRGLAGQSAIFDAYRWLNNTLVTGQLAASGLFHATFTGLNALVSEGALSLQEMALGAQTGNWSLAGKGAARLATAGALGTVGAAAGFAVGGPAGLLWASGYPLAGLKWIKGWRAQKEWLTKDPAGRFFADHVRQMNEGGFRPTWDQFYDNGAMTHAIRALKSGNYPGALLRTIPAAFDALNVPVMRWLVPGVKTAAYLDAVGFELTRLAHHVAGVEDAERELANLPQSPRERSALSPEEKRIIAALEAQRADHLAVIREALNKVQASIDNRFGEVVYDNWFWKRWLKDLTHITFRSPGWQFGTYKEFGGAFTSQLGALGKRIQQARGKREAGPDPEALLSGQMAWLLALVGMTMLMGGMAHYLATGERPQGRDWIFPKGPDGKRRAIPTYLRTIMSAYLHPVKTVGSITAPLNTMLYRLLVSNETYSGEMIREPGDPFLKQAWDALRLVATEGYQPFVASNIARGEGTVESVMGVAPAAAELQRSAAENYLHDVLPPSPARTHAEQQRLEARRDFRTAVKSGDTAKAAAAAQSGGLSRASIMTNVKRAQRDSLSSAFEAATLPQALHAYELAEPAERTELKPLLARKWHTLFKSIAPADKAAVAAQFSAAMKLPADARPLAAAR
jgi:C-terminal domain on Strawberry notch homologue